jgi:transposase
VGATLQREIETLRAELARVTEARDVLARRVVELEQEFAPLREQVRELCKLNELQQADLERYRAVVEASRPNHPERVPACELQLAFERVVEAAGTKPSNDPGDDAADAEASADEPDQDAPTEPPGTAPQQPPDHEGKKKKKKGRHAHGRRPLDLANLPVEPVRITPSEVEAAGGVGYRFVGVEVSQRLAWRPGSYVVLEVSLEKYAPTTAPVDVPEDDDAAEPPAILVAPLPESLWPRVMADPSAIAHIIVSKYDDSLPLHRQERISDRDGFRLPRSTQCGWLRPSHQVLYRITDAMFDEMKSISFCIATDATGARVRIKGEKRCANWHLFVFIGDRDHVVFRYSPEHTSDAVAGMLAGYKGHLLADAAPIFDSLYEDGTIIELACWFHTRRYFYKALESCRELALEPLAIIGKIFAVERETRELPLQDKTRARAEGARPMLKLLDGWIDEHRDRVDPRSPLDAAITYYENQRVALHRFLDDGRILLDNNFSEQQLRNVALGRHNWMFFANEAGIAWYTTFRSLIASCRLHGVNAQTYLEQVLRLAPHWPVTRMLELAPKYWSATVASLDRRQLAIISRPWDPPGEPSETATATFAA